MNLKIEYDPKKCIGNGNCEKLAPHYFKLNNKKANLKSSTFKNGLQILEMQANALDIERAISAGKGCPVNAIKVTIGEKEEVSATVKTDEARKITAKYDDNKEFVLDPKGYFLIRINQDKEEIEVAFCGARNKVEAIVTGKKPIDIYQTSF
ncbi:MAG: ferredoxin [Nanoarchaeota archaeon]